MALRKQEESLFSESLEGQKAKQVFGSKETKEKTTLPSRFLEEIPNNLLENEEKTPEETLKDNINSAKAFLEMMKNRNKK